jgi:hypothetical protein
VPELVVERLGDEQEPVRHPPQGPGDLGEGYAVDPVRVIRGQRGSTRYRSGAASPASGPSRHFDGRYR